MDKMNRRTTARSLLRDATVVLSTSIQFYAHWTCTNTCLRTGNTVDLPVFVFNTAFSVHLPCAPYTT